MIHFTNSIVFVGKCHPDATEYNAGMTYSEKVNRSVLRDALFTNGRRRTQVSIHPHLWTNKFLKFPKILVIHWIFLGLFSFWSLISLGKYDTTSQKLSYPCCPRIITTGFERKKTIFNVNQPYGWQKTLLISHGYVVWVLDLMLLSYWNT